MILQLESGPLKTHIYLPDTHLGFRNVAGLVDRPVVLGDVVLSAGDRQQRFGSKKFEATIAS